MRMRGPIPEMINNPAPITLRGPRIGFTNSETFSQALAAFSSNQSRTLLPALQATPNLSKIQLQILPRDFRIGAVASQIHVAMLLIHPQTVPATLSIAFQAGFSRLSHRSEKKSPTAEATVLMASKAGPATALT